MLLQEAQEAEALLKAIQAKRGPDALANMGKDRKRQMNSFLEQLEEKYAGAGDSQGKKSSSKKKKVGR